MPEPTNPVLIRHLAPRNFLSFGPDNAGIELKALNLFIGPNGCGKSNLIEAISLMRSAPKEMRDVTRKGGGVAEWIWKGGPKDAASVEWVVSNPKGRMPLRHVVAFRSVARRFPWRTSGWKTSTLSQGRTTFTSITFTNTDSQW